ncbi:Oidioi.mRNA.OKI2018_I69.PAR.g13235.t1.cds [Oikopleura dioica]|uniref:Oidioi.mRNA.OKI2018_I69.PAR.g13235.t1.cds n=1 Tax=Oikopleura dioica TaxID=34765 RepID=A0ABN7S974_OIKDI|nr:Oidioi.mRNA.OKI2018_I69.PAR.g13235.t1.cds [Oikopleura dioica]
MCICQDLTIPGANGLEPNECPGDCPKSPYWTKLYWSEDEGWFCLPQGASYHWDPNTCRDQVQCPDQFGNWQTVDSSYDFQPYKSIGKCSVCPPGFREFEVFNGIECCPGQSTYNETLGTCFCQDGVNKPDMFTNECPGDCPAGTTLGSLYPEITCCPPGTSFVDNNGFVGCACDNLSPPTAPDVDGNCPFCATNHHKQKKDNGVEVCCPKNHVWSDIMQKCACPNGAEDQGYGCPGDCPTGEYLYGYSLDGDSLCCPVGSWFDNSPCEQRCRCDYGWNGGTGPEPNAGDTPHPERGCYYCSSELVPFVSTASEEVFACAKTDNRLVLGESATVNAILASIYRKPGIPIYKNVKSCCPVGSELQYNSPALVCFCTNSGNEATSMNSCTGCAQNEVPFWMNHDDTTCCPENRRYFNFAGCQCSDGSMPHGWTGCDGDCPAGWYLAGPAPERECCPIGSDYDNDLKKCICQNGNYINMEPQIVNGESTCGICPQSMTVHYDNGKNIHCCGQNHQFDGQSCVCKNGDPPGANGECNGDCPPGTTYQSNEFGVICCPNDGFTGFNNMNGICMCENGIEADMENYVCPPCPDGLTSFTDMYDNIQCCPANQHWSDNQMGCVCSDGQYPFGDGQCNGDCPWLFNFAKNTPELLCCPANSFYDQDREKCICNPPGMFLDAGISPDPDTHLCPYCGSFDTMYEGKNGPMCCPNNMVYDEINDGCTCPDGSQSWPTNYGPPQCPGDCPAGEYLAHRTLDEKFCCPVGSTPTINGYDDVTCTCFDNNPPDPVNGCPTPCGPGLVPWDDSYNGNQQIACCPPGKIWYPWRNEFMCNGEYLGYNNACEGDCSPGWYKWSEDLCCAVGGSMMWDGSADVCKCPGGTSPNSETGCGFCSNKEIAYRKRDGSEICCQKNMKFNYQSDQCECEGQPLTPTFSPATCKGDCPVGKWIQFKDSGEMICCAIGSWWDVSFQKCMCPDQNEADPDTGCSMCAVDEQIYFDNSGNTRCCRTNQYFDLSWDECRCMDGTRPYNSQCPGDCELGEVMEQFYPEKICCPIGAYWNANAEECICFNGALVDNRCEVNDCAQMDIALITADGVRCCPKNQIWHEGNCRCPDKTNPGSSYNTQGGNGDYNPHPQECPGDCPYGQRFFLDNKGDIVCCPGETGYSAITDTCTCPNGGTYDYENNKCPYCNNNREKEWTDPNGNKMCCTLNQVLTDYSCTCEDGSNPDQNMQCPGDCPQEEYLSDILGGELICCPVGSSLQMMNGVQTATCICDQTGNEPDVETGCNLCNSNQIAFQTGGQWSAHKCCASNLIYSPNANDCTCSNGLPPNGDGSCPGDCAAGFFFVGEYSEVICCPLGSAYNSALEQCQCPDGSEAGDSPCPLCPTHMSSHWTSNGEEKCCFAHTEWSEDLDDCACSDGSFWPHPFQCCPLGSVFEEGECKCSDGGPLDSTYCGQCPENSNAFLDFDNGMTKCCPGNQKWVNGTTGCVCEDESMPLAFGSCPGDCNAGMYPAGIDLNNTLICCPDGAYLDSGECLCNSGSPVINNTCPPCSPNRSPFYDTAGNLLECCLNSQKYIEDTGKCICKDDSLPGYMSACPGDCVSADLFVVQQDPELKCCKAGEYYDQVDQECKCPNGQSYQNNNACGYCDINVGDDGVFNPAINIRKPQINHQYSLEIDDCRCPNGDPFDQYGGCPGDCDPGQILGYVDPTDTLDPIKCCPENSWYDMADKLCKCNSGFAIVNDTCPYCPEHKDVYFDASQNPRCCHKNQMFDQGVEQCICKSDGSIPGYSMNCPNDCDEGEWLGSFEPLECCEIGAKWTSDLGCHCTNGAPLNGTGCGECSDNEIVGFNKDNGAIICCKSNQIFSNSPYECLCPENNSPPWQNGECPGDCEPGFFFASNIDEVLCCPNDSSYDSWMNSCICNNGGIYDPDTGCPPCPPPTVLQTDSNNQTQCCQINQVVTTYGACMCEDGSYPDGPMGSCGNECIDYGDGYWLQSVYPTIECCPLNSYWSDTDGKCYCPNDPAEIPDETGCGYCSISQRTHLDQYGVVQCCEKNKVWFDEDDYTVAGCYCKDGSNSEPNGECPGDCPEDKVFIQAFPRTICCEIGSVYDPIGDECMCPNGEVVDDTACGLCSDPGMRALLDQNDAIRCCERNQIWIADENNPAGGHCRCKDGSEAINLPPSYFPQCGDECEEGTYFVGPNHPTLGCCPYGTQYNSITDECECPNNNEVDDTACGQCSTDQRAHMDEFGNVKCCKRNLFWYDGDDTGPGGCFCDNRTEPFYASNWSTYQQCEIDCEENHVIQFVEPYVQCCPFNSEWNYNLNKCVCDNGDEPDDRACGNCAQPDRAIFDSLGNIQCCQRNLFYFEQDMSGPPGCFCADRSQPLYLTNSMYGECPNDCGEGEYFVRPDPKTICCPLGAEYDNQTKTCKCKFDEPMVDGKCPVCPTGQNPHLDSSFMIQCCDEGFIWIDSLPTMNKCACPGGSTTLPCPPLIQPEQSLCPGDLQYNFNKGECECWDGQAPVDGECNSNTCQDGETAYNNRFGDIMCCPKNTYFKKDRDMCVCTGDLLPTPNGDCPVCAPQETPYVYNDAAGCCPENSYFDQGMLQCKCFFDSTIVEENTGCSPACPPHQIFFKDGGWGNCEDFCQQGQIYNSDSNTCLCPEGHIVGKNEQCPGTPSNCNFDFHPIETENGQVCCHKDAHYSPAHERCICNDGSEPNANQVCSSSCPDGLVYAMYAQSSKMACLCPDTFQYPNVDGICLSSICRTNDVVINFEDGSFACCPVGSTWSSKWNMCICIHQGTLGQCGEKCPDGQISVYNDFNAETECQFVSPCQPGEIQDLAGNCCPQGEVYNGDYLILEK